jgi:hypothetical protein
MIPIMSSLQRPFESRDVAQAIWTSQETKDGMKGDGIDMSSVQIEYLDEVRLRALTPIMFLTIYSLCSTFGAATVPSGSTTAKNSSLSDL